jgi:hypothetical protein
MSKTPRTDRQSFRITPIDGQCYSTDYCPDGTGLFVTVDFARTQELELAVARAELERVGEALCSETTRANANAAALNERDAEMEKVKGEMDGWRRVVTDCERIMDCPDTAQSPSMSNLPNIVRDLKRIHLPKAESALAALRAKVAEAVALLTEHMTHIMYKKTVEEAINKLRPLLAPAKEPSAAPERACGTCASLTPPTASPWRAHERDVRELQA